MNQNQALESTSNPPDPEYLARKKLSGSMDEACRNVNPVLAFEGFPFGGKPMLETPSQQSLDAYRLRILARHGR